MFSKHVKHIKHSIIRGIKGLFYKLLLSFCVIFYLLILYPKVVLSQNICGLGVAGDRIISFSPISVDDARLFVECCTIRQSHLWVNLSPKSRVNSILPGYLWAGKIGAIFLQTDLRLKKEVMDWLDQRGQIYEVGSEDIFRVFIKLKQAKVGHYLNAYVLESLSLEVVFDGRDKDFIDLLNRTIAKDLSRQVNNSPVYLPLRKVVAMYILSRFHKLPPKLRFYISQQWVDRRSGLLSYLDLFYGDTILGGIDIDMKHVEQLERNYNVDLSTRYDLKFMGNEEVFDNIDYIRRAKRLVLKYSSDKSLEHVFSPEFRLLRDLYKLKSPKGKILSRPEDIEVSVTGKVASVWSRLARKALKKKFDKLKDMVLSSAKLLSKENSVVFSVEGNLDENFKPQIFQVRPVYNLGGLPSLEDLKQSFFDFLESVTAQFSKVGRIKICKGSSLFLKIRFFLGELDEMEGDNYKILIDKLIQNQKALMCLLLFDDEGHHYLISLILKECIDKLGPSYTIKTIEKVISVYNKYDLKQMEKVADFPYYRNLKTADFNMLPLFGLSGGLVLLGLKDEGLEFLERLLEALPKKESSVLKKQIINFLARGAFGEIYAQEAKRKEFVDKFLGDESLRPNQPFKPVTNLKAEGQNYFRLLDKNLDVDSVVGRLVVINKGTELADVRDGDIIVVKSDLPSEYPLLRSIPSAIVVIGDEKRLVCPQSHIRTYIRQRQIPVFVASNDTLGLVKEMAGKYAKISILSQGRYNLKSADKSEFDTYIKEKILPERVILQKKIEEVKNRLATVQTLKILPLNSKLLTSGEFGVKAVNLSRLIQFGVSVPKGVAVSVGLLPEILSGIKGFDWKKWDKAFKASVNKGTVDLQLEELAGLLIDKIYSMDLSRIINQLWDALPRDLRHEPLIMRSCSQLEDMLDLPYVGTGVLESKVIMEPNSESLEKALKDVVCSLFSRESLAEKVSLGINPRNIGLGLIVQRFSLSQVGMVAEVKNDEITASLVLGSNTLITSDGKSMGDFADFVNGNKFIARFYRDRVLRYEQIFKKKKALPLKLFEIWREAIICLSNWHKESEQLYWVQLWDMINRNTDEKFKKAMYDFISEWLTSLKKSLDERKLSLSDKILLYWLPLYVLGKKQDCIGKYIPELEQINPAVISGLQVILKVCPWAVPLDQIKRFLVSQNRALQRLGANILFYAIDVDGILRKTNQSDQNKLGGAKNVGGIWISE